MRIARLRKVLGATPDPRNTAALLAFHRAQFGAARMEDPPADPPKDPPADPPTDPPKAGEHGFPENTPLERMSSEQREAYWRHYARKHETTAKARQDYDDVKAERDRLLAEHGSEQEKAVKQARDEAAAAERAKLAPQLVAAEFRAQAAGRTVNGRPVDVPAIVEDLDTSKYLTATGEVDSDKVVKKLDAIAPKVADDGRRRRGLDLGQGNRGGGNVARGEAGAAEADRRFAKSTK